MSRLDFAKLIVTYIVCVYSMYLHLKIGHFCLVVNSFNSIQNGMYYYIECL